MSIIGLFQDPTNITELFTFDLGSFFYEEDYEEINSQDEQGVFMVEYEKKLPWIELQLFDTIIFRVYNDKVNVEGSSHINVRLPANPDLVSIENSNQLINLLFKTYGLDDNNMGGWNKTDEEKWINNNFLRTWTLGEGNNVYTVKISKKETDKLHMEILFFNHLLNLTNN